MISLLVVNYRSATLAIDAIRSARLACVEPLEVVVVDNSCDAAEATLLEPVADRLLVSTTNRGYAGAINDGRRHCGGDVVVVSNPDVVFDGDAIALLAAAVRAGAAAAGPSLSWDAAHQWLLPPGDVNRGSDKLGEVFAARSAAWARIRDRARIRRRLAFWTRNSTAHVDTLSGAVLAIAAGDFDDVDGFDERFALYFEETDFLRRLRARRRGVVHVPAAKCRHLFNQSAGQDSAAAADRYAESERRYLEKWNGPWAARTLLAMSRPIPPGNAAPMMAPLTLERDDVLVEASPLASFATAAGTFPAGRRVVVPDEILLSLRGAPLYLRAIVRDSLETIGSWVLPAGSRGGEAQPLR
jgi:N-acetylglucosaminyl-diphospho-decaprenol L-rhamnosyltransferase